MATDHRDTGLGPQTPAARRTARPGERLTPEARERLRAESRARRQARPEPLERPEPEAEAPITVRRLSDEAPRPAPEAPITVRRLPDEASRPAPAVARPPAPKHLAALVGLVAALGIVIALSEAVGPSGAPLLGTGEMEAQPSARAVAPGGWMEMTGAGAPADARLVLESRSRGGRWRSAGHATSDDDGRFRLRGRVLERPGRVLLRARAPGVAVAAPVAVDVRPLRLASVGDINLGDAPGEAIAANGPRYPWETAGGALRSADIAFGNLECAISTRGAPVAKQFTFRGTPAALAGLRRHSGIDVLNLANNHVGDFGTEATLDTVRHVERLGMKAVGAGPDLPRALAPQVLERLGLRVAFVGFSEIAPIEFAATEDRPGTAWARPEEIAASVRAARRQADVVVATFHWGIEKQTLETAQQRALADVAVAAGAQVVIGAHPHTLQPVRRQGAALVAYSLGNFVFGAASEETTSTGILEVDLAAEGVSAARWRPGRISGGRPVLDGAPRRLPLRDALSMEAGVNL
jgi:poly-gamma-glutamate synthesis protein (capsule biosynthesis protein)